MKVVRLYFGSVDGFIGLATPFHGYALMHDAGVVLIDTGFGATLGGTGYSGVHTVGDQRYPWVRRSTVDALLDHGIEPADVRYIINTHLGDHSADNELFRHATVVVQQPEVEWVRRSFGADHPRRYGWDFPEAKLELLGGEDAAILAGVTCLFTPGHTPGHQSILVDHGDTRDLFVGDAVYTLDLWQHPEKMREDHPTWHAQAGAHPGWAESAAKLRALDADNYHFAHDRSVGHRHGPPSPRRPG
jgi:glyoxylase-like metal-dependent hydrolase (beta-lactamase superfamily II)